MIPLGFKHTEETKLKISNSLRESDRSLPEEKKACLVCSKKFSIPNKEGKLARSKRKYCSRKCSFEAVPSKGWRGDKKAHIRGELNHNWRGGRTITTGGYVKVRVDGKYILEHRLVMEKILGRPLTKQEQVHHKDANRQNNDSSNLELRSGPHGAGATKHCPTCTCCEKN